MIYQFLKLVSTVVLDSPLEKDRICFIVGSIRRRTRRFGYGAEGYSIYKYYVTTPHLVMDRGETQRYNVRPHTVVQKRDRVQVGKRAVGTALTMCKW